MNAVKIICKSVFAPKYSASRVSLCCSSLFSENLQWTIFILGTKEDHVKRCLLHCSLECTSCTHACSHMFCSKELREYRRIYNIVSAWSWKCDWFWREMLCCDSTGLIGELMYWNARCVCVCVCVCVGFGVFVVCVFVCMYMCVCVCVWCVCVCMCVCVCQLLSQRLCNVWYMISGS